MMGILTKSKILYLSSNARGCSLLATPCRTIGPIARAEIQYLLNLEYAEVRCCSTVKTTDG